MMFVWKSKYDAAVRDSLVSVNDAHFWERQFKNMRKAYDNLSAEIADRHRSETDAREQLRAIRAKMHRNRGADGRFVKS